MRGIEIRWVVRALAIGSALGLAPLALACGNGSSCPNHADAKHASANPGSCARSAQLVGSNCSYTTSTMAKRVLDSGRPWAFNGRLMVAENELASHVAAPYTAGPDGVFVVANEVLDELTRAAAPPARVELEGKLLEVDGVKYFVVTDYRTGAV